MFRRFKSPTYVVFRCLDMVFEILNKLSFLIVHSVVAAVSASYYQKEFSGYLFTTFSYNSYQWSNQYDAAQNWCNQNGSKLLAITNSSIQNASVAFINDTIRQNQLTSSYIITDGKRTFDTFKWINETSSSPLSIGGQDTNKGYAVSYVYSYKTSTGLTLWAAQSTDMNNYICEFAGQTSCSNGYQFGGQCFQSFVNERVTWFEARNRCLMKGGDLATFEFITTNDGLNSLNGSWINPSTQYWIGLRRQWWTWQSINSDVTYSQWADGQPQYNSNDNLDCLCLEPNDWKWIAFRCTDSAQFVCIRASSSSGYLVSTTTRSTTTARTLSSNSQSPSTLNNPTPSSSSSSSTIAIQNETNVLGSAYGKDKLAIGLGVGLGGGVLLIIILIIVSILLSRKGYIKKKSNPNAGAYVDVTYESGCLPCGSCCFCRKSNGQITKNDSENNVTSESPSTYESLKNGTRHDINNSAPTYQELNITE